jgi:putative aminopeptidase FrvX
MWNHLKTLASLTGPSGHEHDIAAYIYEKLQGMVDELIEDSNGNLIAIRRGTDSSTPSVGIAAHMDEIGWMVKKIESNGFIRFEKIGGSDERVLWSQRVWIRTEEQGRVLGVMGHLSAHYKRFEEGNMPVKPHRSMYIDVGARTVEEVHGMGIHVGDPISYAAEMTELGTGTGRWVGKAFDDRVACAMLLRLFEELKDQPPSGDVIGYFTVQEEVGLRGARMAVQRVKPDYALAIDTTACGDAPDGLTDGTIRLGDGAAIKYMDFSLIAHKGVRRQLEALAERYGIQAQPEIMMGIGTDAGALHENAAGVPTGVISIPSRYTHSPIEVIDAADVEAAYALMKAFVQHIDELKNYRFISS